MCWRLREDDGPAKPASVATPGAEEAGLRRSPHERWNGVKGEWQFPPLSLNGTADR